MDCLCCADGGTGPTTDDEFLGSVCNLMTADGVPAKFPAEPDRYVLYVIAGCPFAARPWAIQAIYGLPIQVVKLFPASYDQGWFFSPTTDGEKDLVANFPEAQIDPDPLHGSHHLIQLYTKANPTFKGAVSVPLLWDKDQDTAVSNSSLGLAEMLYTQMRGMATRNQDLELFPLDPTLKQEHSNLVKFLHSKVSTAVYKMNATHDGEEHDKLVEEYYATLRELEQRIIASKGPYLMGEQVRFADILFWISLLRLDLAYQWRFGLGKYSIREDYPRLQQYVEQMMKIEGLAETVLPRDIMALYFMTLKWTQNGNGRSLPQVPHSWEQKVMKKE
jgi:putative glutathione S-transferase